MDRYYVEIATLLKVTSRWFMRKKIILTYLNDIQEIKEEHVWAIQQGSAFIIDNIPFFAPNIAYKDIVSIENDDDNLHFDDILEESGHSTIQITFFNHEKIQDTLLHLESMGCSWEGMKGFTYFAIDIPDDIDYSLIQDFLDSKFDQKILDYRESCLSENHRYFANKIEDLGHIQLIFFNHEKIQNILTHLESIGCSWKAMKHYPHFALYNPKNTDYSQIKNFLDSKFNQKILDYRENLNKLP